MHRQAPFVRVHGKELAPGQFALLRMIPNWNVTRRTALVAYRRDLKAEEKEPKRMRASSTDAYTAQVLGEIMQGDRELLSM